MSSVLQVHDVVERKAGKPAPMPASDEPFDMPATGFPSHKRRLRVSKFKQNQQLAKANAAESTPESDGAEPLASNKKTVSFVGPERPPKEMTERERIDYENKQRIASMSVAEIEEARHELMNGLNPELLHRLMMRANLDEQQGPSPFDIPDPTAQQQQPASPQAKPSPPQAKPSPPPAVTVEDADEPERPAKPVVEPKSEPAVDLPKKPLPKNLDPNTPFDEDLPPTNPPDDLRELADLPVKPHFPMPQIADLDPEDPDFLETLRTKYFPETPADPTKLAWMAPLPTTDSIADRQSPYHPGQESISTSALRFDFRGKMLPPSLSRSIPVSKGLHHHGLAPEAAGYTIEELAIYARSAVPAQRCIAFQTLGRILFRLGHGDWGTGVEDPIAMGIWHSIKEGRVLDSLMMAATQTSGHRGSQAYATEALWLFEKGGWKEKTRGR